MTQEIFFYLQLLVFVMNICVFIFIMNEKKVKYKFIRAALIVAMCIGLFFNLGKLTWFTVLFAFTPFISLLKLPHEHINRIAETGGDYIRGRSKPVQSVSRGSKTVH